MASKKELPAASSLAENEGFQEDARAFLGIPKDKFDSAISMLAGSTKVLDRAALIDVVTSLVDEEAGSFRSFLLFLQAIRPAEQRKAYAEELAQALCASGFIESLEMDVLPPGDEVNRRFAEVAGDYPSLARAEKVTNLKRATGSTVEDLTFITDLRPVYNEDRTAIDGLIPITTLHIDVSGRDAFDVTLSEDELTELSSKVSQALTKLAAAKLYPTSTSR